MPRPPAWKALLASAAAAALGCGPSPADLEDAAAACPEVGAGGFATGVNAYYLQEEAARSLRGDAEAGAHVEEVLGKAAALGAAVVRTWAFNDDPAHPEAIQTPPLAYQETSLRGLDWVLTRAAAHGVKLILPLGNRWNEYGGARQYVTWAGLPDPVEGDERFVTDPGVIAHYRAHLRSLLSRRNTFDGQPYGQHPAVLAWELLNEPRATAENGPAFPRVDRAFGLGGEGAGAGAAGGDGGGGLRPGVRRLRGGAVVPGGAAAVRRAGPLPGEPRLAPEDIPRAGAAWIREHAALARGAGKQLVLGELGLQNAGAFTLEERRAIYRGWLRCSRASGALAALPWMFAYDARPDEWDRYTFYFRDGTRPEDPVNRYADLLIEAARGGP